MINTFENKYPAIYVPKTSHLYFLNRSLSPTKITFLGESREELEHLLGFNCCLRFGWEDYLYLPASWTTFSVQEVRQYMQRGHKQQQKAD